MNNGSGVSKAVREELKKKLRKSTKKNVRHACGYPQNKKLQKGEYITAIFKRGNIKKAGM